jgi:hypothetical protein
MQIIVIALIRNYFYPFTTGKNDGFGNDSTAPPKKKYFKLLLGFQRKERLKRG